MSVESSSETQLAVASDLSWERDGEDIGDRRSLNDVENNIIPEKIPAKLCADCARLFQRNNWSWELHRPDDATHEPYYQILPESLPVPRLRPVDCYEDNYWDIDDDCTVCSSLALRVKWHREHGANYFTSTEPKLLDNTEVDQFRWGVRLYNNGFIELWLGYRFYDPNRSFEMSRLVTLVPVTEVGWCLRNLNSISQSSLVPQPTSESRDSEESFQLTRGWLDDCQSHEKCSHELPGTVKRLPTRLIHVSRLPGDLKDSDIKIKAKICQGSALPKDTLYATLSHCWGKVKFLTLTKDNLDQMVRDIPVAQLSQVFQDAMRVTLGLGLSYLWIDSLCIVQDSENLEDWKREAPRMGDVYGQATLGISATGFANGESGLFGRPRTISREHSIACVPVDWELEKMLPNLSTVCGGLFAFTNSIFTKGFDPFCAPQDVIDNSPLYNRGWTLQERVLPPRVIHFGATHIMWECEKLVASDTFPANFLSAYWSMEDVKQQKEGTAAVLSIRRLPFLSKIEIRLFWRNFVELYSQGEFTVADDRVAAVTGIAQILGRISGDRYIFGCWLSDIHMNLLWWSKPDPTAELTSIPMQRRAPSWSWLSVDGRIHFLWHPRDNAKPFTDVIISTCCREGWSESTAEDGCMRLNALSDTSLIVEGPLYSIRHPWWTCGMFKRVKHDMCYASLPGAEDLYVKIDAEELEKPTEPGLHRQHLLRWATPTHLLPLTWWKLGVQGLLMVEDPEEENVFIRVGSFARLFSGCFEANARAVFGGDGFDRDLNEVAQAGLCFLGTRTFLVE